MPSSIGSAAYPSTVLMNCIPAAVAGVEEIVIATPPKRGGIAPAVAAAAKIAGVGRVVTVGGAQAVAALAYGTETLPRVDKIVGPGNIYVAEAKKQLFGRVDIDMIAGPSEVLIVADESADADFAAGDEGDKRLAVCKCRCDSTHRYSPLCTGRWRRSPCRPCRKW